MVREIETNCTAIHDENSIPRPRFPGIRNIRLDNESSHAGPHSTRSSVSGQSSLRNVSPTYKMHEQRQVRFYREKSGKFNRGVGDKRINRFWCPPFAVHWT